MTTIACVKQGTKYGPEYVRILYDMVRRNLFKDVAYRFVCFTDDTTGLEGIETAPLPGDLRGWWAKMYLFSPQAFPRGERIVYLDLDTAIVGDIEFLLEYRGRLGAIDGMFYFSATHLNSGIMAWEAGTLDHIWHTWNACLRPMPDTGDQTVIEQYAGEWERLQDVFPGKLVSYKRECMNRPPGPEAAIVAFHGFPKPHECDDEWLKGVWREAGWSGATVRTFCNTILSEIEDNIRWSVENVPHRFQEKQEHTRTAVIVGGGPSLEASMPSIMQMVMRGASVFAINGAAKYLDEHGIRPNWQLICDARPENVRFVNGGHANGYLIASQCHKSVFKRIGLDRAIRWHCMTANMREFLVDIEPDCVLIGGGTTTLTRGMQLIHGLGYRSMHLYGVDSSYRMEAHHAYEQRDLSRTVTAHVGRNSFVTSAWMIAQTNDFQVVSDMLMNHGTTITVHGDGLLPTVAREMMGNAVLAN